MHIRALMKLDELDTVYDYDNPAPLSAEQAAKIDVILKEAKDLTARYMHLYGEVLPDRGGEGQLVSYAVTTPVFIDAVAAHFDDSIRFVQEETYDAPPMPDAEVR